MELITKYLTRDSPNGSNRSQSCSARQSGGPEVVIKNEKAGYEIARGSMERLQPRKWLNDEIINAYIALVNMR